MRTKRDPVLERPAPGGCPVFVQHCRGLWVPEQLSPRGRHASAPPGDSEDGAREAVVPPARGARCGPRQGRHATPCAALGAGDRYGQRTCGHILQSPAAGAGGWGPMPLAKWGDRTIGSVRLVGVARR